MNFSDLRLSTPILNALADGGFTTPTTIQQKAFSVILSGKDVCGIAQTGTGKTFAYALPMLRDWKFTKDPLPTILVLVPTRELAVQVAEAFKELTTYMSVTTVAVYGGVNLKPQAAAIQDGCDIIVATPGRLLDLILNGAFKTKLIKKLVIDEVDEMMNLGFRPQLIRLLDVLPERRQNLMFSATLTNEVENLLDTFFNAPVKIEAAPTGTPLENIRQSGYAIPNFLTKVNVLEHLLRDEEEMNKVLIFTATKKLADELFIKMEEVFPGQGGVIHSNKAQNNRFATVNNFRDGNHRFIIATDIVARGIDIEGVSHVINFDMPDVPENYMHRIGRTGRADREGLSLAFITPADDERQQDIEALMQYSIPMVELPEAVEISDIVLEWEKPKVKMKTYLTALPDRSSAGAAFHEKSPKNRKVNNKVSHREKMQKKYGKPKKRKKK